MRSFGVRPSPSNTINPFRPGLRALKLGHKRVLAADCTEPAPFNPYKNRKVHADVP